MPSGWDVYYVLFLAGGMALGIPLVLSVLSRALAPESFRQRRNTDQSKIPSEKSEIGARLNVRFFSNALVAILLVFLMLLLIPCVIAVRDVQAATAVVVVTALALLGLLYSAKKGDFEWLMTWRRRDDR